MSAQCQHPCLQTLPCKALSCFGDLARHSVAAFSAALEVHGVEAVQHRLQGLGRVEVLQLVRSDDLLQRGPQTLLQIGIASGGGGLRSGQAHMGCTATVQCFRYDAVLASTPLQRILSSSLTLRCLCA